VSDGSKEWTAEAQEELGHKFGSDSVFWITFEDLVRKYTHFDRTRLFREDDDWRCCQRWIGVDVPWKAEYHEKFRIKLTKDSPLILVLSQLDGRYFKGLQGQYSFRLHFRLHHEDQPDAEDYIVRSHGNYFMKRSVSVELPDLPSGNYTVYLKVTGQRNQELPSVEEVVKRESQKRVENEKLAQVATRMTWLTARPGSIWKRLLRFATRETKKRPPRTVRRSGDGSGRGVTSAAT